MICLKMYRSAFVLVLVILSASAMTRRAADQEPQNQADSINESRATETPFNSDTLNSTKHNITQDDAQHSGISCFLAYSFKWLHLLNEDGTVNTPELIRVIPQIFAIESEDEKSDSITRITGCATEKGANDCETVSKFWSCLQRSYERSEGVKNETMEAKVQE